MSVNHQPTGAIALRNARTCFTQVDAERRSALEPRAAFILAHERLELLAHASSDRSVVVVAVDVYGQVVASRRVFHGQAVVIGRHEQCGLRLTPEDIALRQVVALVDLAGGRSVVHLRDLATRQPFVTEDGERTAGISADGPAYVAIGGVALWFVPSDALPRGVRSAEAAWNALAPRCFFDRRAPMDAPRHPPPLDIAPGSSRITHMGPPLLLDSGDAPEVAWGVLRIEVGHKKERRSVSAERLEQGLLLGRYSRCSVLVDASASTTSRVHALLLRLGADVWIIDLASTNGVRRNGARLSADILRDHDRVSLGPGVTVEWTRTIHAQA